jgi:Protein of unknown function (DUF3891)
VLLRRDEHGVLAIGQASHAWLSGQLARSWGNEQFGSFEPREEVCLAAAQHDVGMAAWDSEPSFDPRTGLPNSFMEMPLEVHLDLWLRGPRRLVSQSTYAALLVSMHGWRLYARRDLARSPGEEAQAIREFLDAQRRFQDDLRSRLERDERSAEAVRPLTLERNSLLLWTWDYLSLAVCLNWDSATAKGAPTATGAVDLELCCQRPGSFTLGPWPFAEDTVTVRCEGRRLPESFPNEAAMRRGLAQAPVEILELELARSACSPASPAHGA